MELIGKQIAIETILGQPPELHYPSWYAAQIEKLPPAPPEYLAEQAGILVADADTISRAKAIETIDSFNVFESRGDQIKLEQMIGELPPAQLGTNLAEVGTDCISRQVTIDALLRLTNCKTVRELFEYNATHNLAEMRTGGINDAIDAIIAVPPAQPERTPMQELLDVTADRDYWKAQCHSYEATINRLTESAQPERIKGHWIESNGLNILMKKFIEKGETWRVCDKCGAGFMIGYQYECDKLYHETFHNFCPNCGAEMEVTT